MSRALPVSCPEEPQGLLVCTECGGAGDIVTAPSLSKWTDDPYYVEEHECSACLGTGTLVAPISIVDMEAQP